MSIFSRLPPWRRALPWVFLTISVAFNIAFFIGEYWHERFRSEIEPAIAESAKLGAEQSEALKGLRQRIRGEIMTTAKEGSRRTGLIWDDLRERPVDRGQIDESLRSLAEIRLKAQGRVLDEVIQFLDTLPPEQRARTVEAIRRRDPITRTLLLGPGGLPRGPYQQGRPGEPPPPPPPAEPRVAP